MKTHTLACRFLVRTSHCVYKGHESRSRCKSALLQSCVSLHSKCTVRSKKIKKNSASLQSKLRLLCMLCILSWTPKNSVECYDSQYNHRSRFFLHHHHMTLSLFDPSHVLQSFFRHSAPSCPVMSFASSTLLRKLTPAPHPSIRISPSNASIIFATRLSQSVPAKMGSQR